MTLRAAALLAAGFVAPWSWGTPHSRVAPFQQPKLLAVFQSMDKTPFTACYFPKGAIKRHKWRKNIILVKRQTWRVKLTY